MCSPRFELYCNIESLRDLYGGPFKIITLYTVITYLEVYLGKAFKPFLILCRSHYLSRFVSKKSVAIIRDSC